MSNKTRVVLFGSFYGGYHFLNEMLTGSLSESVEVVGVATDDPRSTYVSAHKRLWSYPHTRVEEELVSRLAEEHGVPVYTGKIKTPEFYRIYENDWRPDLCLMATFGQVVDRRLIHFPTLGFYNFHHSSDDGWPSYPGPNPIQHMVDDGKDYVVISMHTVEERIDHGELVARSARVPMPPEPTPVKVHRITWASTIAYFSHVIEHSILNRHGRLGMPAAAPVADVACAA